MRFLTQLINIAFLTILYLGYSVSLFFFAFFAVDVFLIVGVHPSKNPSSLSMLVQLVRNITQIILSAYGNMDTFGKGK